MSDRDRDRESEDRGAFIGRKPERATETIPGGVGRKDERVAAHSTQSGPHRGPTPESTEGSPPEGHREGPPADDDAVREAGESH
jgi:hypothetical protein